jgi:hypothetical protein
MTSIESAFSSPTRALYSARPLKTITSRCFQRRQSIRTVGIRAERSEARFTRPSAAGARAQFFPTFLQGAVRAFGANPTQ